MSNPLDRARQSTTAWGALLVSLAVPFLPFWGGDARPDAAQVPLKSVVFLLTEEASRPVNTESERAIRKTMDGDATVRIEYHYEFLDLRRFHEEGYGKALTQFLREKYTGRPPDLVMPVGPGSLAYALRYREAIFPDVPMVYCNVLDTEERLLARGEEVTGIAMRLESLQTVEAALRMLPGVRRVVVVGGASDLDGATLLIAKRGWEKLEGRVTVEEWAGLPLDDLLSRLQGLRDDSIVFYAGIYEDGTGRAFAPSEVLESVAAASGAPVFSWSSTFMGQGITGGYLYDVARGAARAAETARKVLHGASPSAPSIASEGLVAPAFDARELKRFGVPRGLLPPGSDVLFYEPPVWRRNPWLAAGVFSFAVFETLLIVGLALELRKRRRAELSVKENERRLSLATEVAELGVWEWIAKEDRIRASPETLAMHGMERLPDPTLGDGEQFVHPEDRPRLVAAREEARRIPGRYDVEFRIRKPDGTVRWLSVTGASFAGPSGKVERLVGVTRDITARKTAEDELSEMEARIRLAATSAKIGFWEWRSDTERYWVSEEARELYELGDEPEIDFSSVIAKVHPEDLPRFLEVRERAASDPGSYEVDYRILLTGGRVRWLSVRATSFADPSGKMVRLLGATQDITERKDGEDRLHASEERYRAFLKYSTEGVCRYETSEPIPVTLPDEEQVERIFRCAYVAECNGAFAGMFGRSSEEMAGMPMEQILPSSDPRNLQYIRKFVQAGYRQLGDESYKVDREGNTRCMASSGAGILENGCLVRVWSIQRDITDQKAAEAALRENEGRYRSLFEAAVDGIAVADAETGVLVECNGALQAMVGCTREELIGKPEGILHPPRPPRAVTPPSPSHGDGPAESLLEDRLMHKDGSLLDVEIKAALFELGGRPRHLYIFRDITERKRTQAALSESQAQLVALVESTRDLIWSVDATRFGLLTFNRALRDYFMQSYGLPIREGMTPAELLPPDYARLWSEFYSRALREGPFSTDYQTSSGTLALVLSFNLVKRGNEILGISVFGGDVTNRRRAEMEADELRRDLAHLTRVATMGELTGALAHELNQPLTAIRSNAQAALQLLAKGRLTPEEAGEILGDIVADDQRASEIIHRLRAMLKKGRIETQLLDLNDLIEEVVSLVKPDAALKGVRLTMDLTPDLPRVGCDRIQMQQVFLNLLANAMDATMGTTSRWVRIRTFAHGDGEVRAVVRDRGAGIGDGLAERIFQPFVTTKEEGMGMGLAICRSIVAAHGGRIWGENDPRGGARFTVALPAQAEAK